MKSAAVYLGSAKGGSAVYMETAYNLGKELAAHGIKVIYGGSGVGTMGALADGVIAEGGDIIGIFPEGFKGKKARWASGERIDRIDLTDLVLVKDFAERKKVMERDSDCAVALPGGYGTMDELFEYAVGNEIGRHDKKCFVLNVGGFYDGMKAMVEKMAGEGFIPDRSSLQFVDTVDELISKIEAL